MYWTICNARQLRRIMNPKLAISAIFLLLLICIFALFYVRSDAGGELRPSAEEVSKMPMDTLYKAYRRDIENNRPSDFSLSLPLSSRGSEAAFYMINQI